MNSDPKSLNETTGCRACREGKDLGFEVTMAFQPIVNVATQTVFAYEALVRGVDGASAPQVLSRVNQHNLYTFDQVCRVRAIELAAKLRMPERGAKLSVNFMPGAVYSPAACIRRTLETARQYAFPLESIIFEITEGERVANTSHLARISEEYARHGFTMALDDYGAAYSGLNLLAELDQIKVLKLDGKLIRGIDKNRRSEFVVASTARMCRELGVMVVGECVETVGEYTTLLRCGVELMQGYLFARPEVERLPEVTWPSLAIRKRPADMVQVLSPAFEQQHEVA